MKAKLREVAAFLEDDSDQIEEDLPDLAASWRKAAAVLRAAEAGRRRLTVLDGTTAANLQDVVDFLEDDLVFHRSNGARTTYTAPGTNNLAAIRVLSQAIKRLRARRPST